MPVRVLLHRPGGSSGPGTSSCRRKFPSLSVRVRSTAAASLEVVEAVVWVFTASGYGDRDHADVHGGYTVNGAKLSGHRSWEQGRSEAADSKAKKSAITRILPNHLRSILEPAA